MSVLLLRTLSQALQALAPIAVALTWFERTNRIRTAAAIRRGLIVSVPTTVVASWLFQHSSHASLDEALLATMAVVVTAAFVGRVLPPPREATADHRSLGEGGLDPQVRSNPSD